MFNAEAWVRGLTGVTEVGFAWDELARLAREGRLPELLAVEAALDSPAAQGLEDWVRSSIRNRVERTLALHPSPEWAWATLCLKHAQSATSSTNQGRATSINALAALLASHHSVETLLDLLPRALRDPRLHEVLGCWVQEMVVRGHDFRSQPSVRRLWRNLRWRHYPLWWLPLELLAVERHLARFLPLLRLDSTGHRRPGLPFTRSDQGPGAPSVGWVEVRAPDHLAEAVRTWSGRQEARVFRLPRPLPSGERPDPKCLIGATRVDWYPADLPRVLELLFAAAANGGAGGGWRWGAQARLDAWLTVSALIGSSPRASVSQVAQTATECSWWELDASPWFFHDGWDLGLVCLDRKHTRLALLAASDTD